MTSLELRRAIEGGLRTAVVPFGSVERHGGHLPLGTDALLADLVGEAVAARLDAVLAPTIRIGCAEHHIVGTGTLSVPAETVRDVAFHTGASLARHGLLVIALISTHGGNQDALEKAAGKLNERYRDVIAHAPRGDVGPAPGSHSGRWLTSVMLYLRPDLVEVESASPDLVDEVRAASREEGAENLERFVSTMVHAIRY